MTEQSRVIALVSLAVFALACVAGAVIDNDLQAQLLPLAGVSVGAIAGVVVPKTQG